MEPNSGLGKAIAYMLRHWEKLTLFLRTAGAPLDNNICERALKKAILHRTADAGRRLPAFSPGRKLTAHPHFPSRRGRPAGGMVEALVARRDGVIAKLVRTPGTLYVNGRLMVDGPQRIRPSVAELRHTGGRDFALVAEWQADDPIPENYRPFLHFCDEQGEMLFQGPSRVRSGKARDHRG